MNWKRSFYIILVAQMFTSMGFSLIFPFLPFYIKELDTALGLGTEVLSGLVFSSQALAMALVSPLWGAIADRYGKKPMVVRAMIGGAVTVFLMGFVKTAEQLIFLRICQGLLSGVISATSALTASFAPREKSGYVMGSLQVAVWSGVATGPFIGGILADISGIRTTFVITGTLLFLSGVSVLLFVHEKADVKQKKEKKNSNLFSDWKSLFTNKKVMVVYVLRFLSSMANNMLYPVLPFFLAAMVGVKENLGTLTGTVIGVMSVSTIVGGFVMARSSDKFGHKKVVILASAFTALFFIPQGLVGKMWQFVALSLFAGLCSGALTPSLSALLVQSSDRGTEGSIYGFDNSIVAAGRAVAPIAGSLLAVQFSYKFTFIATGLVFMVMAIFAYFLPKKNEFVYDREFYPVSVSKNDFNPEP
ncbi:MAG: multidrug efflux MFS transporter [Fibrobacter sp.]|jgi:DHA1 family multidrug resistance protein-like MFS transporter|nr:multidrug efflux MFS transporter [Fibrobacter sp.]